MTGGLIGHFWRGMSRADVKDLGELIGEGRAALVVVGESRFQQYLERASPGRSGGIDRQIRADGEVVQRELDKASKQQA